MTFRRLMLWSVFIGCAIGAFQIIVDKTHKTEETLIPSHPWPFPSHILASRGVQYGHIILEDKSPGVQYVSPKPEPPRGPKTISELLGKSLIDHQPSKYRQLVMYNAGTLWNDESSIDHLAFTFEKIGKWMMKAPNDRINFKELWLRQWVPTSDQYGKSDRSVSITVSWLAKDIRKIQWNNLPATRLLDLGTLIQLKPVIWDGAIQWCKKNQQNSPRFCAQVLTSVQR